MVMKPLARFPALFLALALALPWIPAGQCHPCSGGPALQRSAPQRGASLRPRPRSSSSAKEHGGLGHRARSACGGAAAGHPIAGSPALASVSDDHVFGLRQAELKENTGLEEELHTALNGFKQRKAIALKQVNGILDVLRERVNQKLGLEIEWGGGAEYDDRIHLLMQGFLDYPAPPSVANEVRVFLQSVNQEVLGPLREVGDDWAIVLPRADDWMAYQVFSYYADHRLWLLKKRMEALAVYSVRGSALAFGRNGPHLRSEFTAADAVDIETAPILMLGFLPYLGRLLGEVNRRRSENQPDGNLEQEARDYVGALLNGLLIPPQGLRLAEYEDYFNGWMKFLEEHGMDKPEILLAEAIKTFPDAAVESESHMPRYLAFHGQSFASGEVLDIISFNTERMPGTKTSLWDLTVGRPLAEPYMVKVIDRGTSSLWAAIRDPEVLNQVRRFLLNRGTNASTRLPEPGADRAGSGSAGLEEHATFAWENLSLDQFRDQLKGLGLLTEPEAGRVFNMLQAAWSDQRNRRFALAALKLDLAGMALARAIGEHAETLPADTLKRAKDLLDMIRRELSGINQTKQVIPALRVVGPAVATAPVMDGDFVPDGVGGTVVKSGVAAAAAAEFMRGEWDRLDGKMKLHLPFIDGDKLAFRLEERTEREGRVSLEELLWKDEEGNPGKASDSQLAAFLRLEFNPDLERGLRRYQKYEIRYAAETAEYWIRPIGQIPNLQSAGVIRDENTGWAGLEEEWTPERWVEFQSWIAGRGDPLKLDPAELGSTSRMLRQAAVSPNLDIAMEAQWVRADRESKLYQAALQQVGGIHGDWTPPESPAPLAFLFEGDHLHWAPFVAQAGARVGVIVETALEAKGLQDLFEGLGVPEGRYKIVSLDVEIDRSLALETLRQHFQRPGFPPVQFVELPADAPAEEIEQTLRRYGLRFDTSPTPRLIAVDRYLGGLA